MTKIVRERSVIISRQNGKSNTQTGRLNPQTLLHRRYTILRTIGHGGMAAVYQAQDKKRQTVVAVKEMSLSSVATEERRQAIQNFLAEARILSRLNHPNLPEFTDFFTEDSRYFLVMEYVDGKTLEDLLEQNTGPFSERRVLGWARQLCDVLEYLHAQQPPVIFRDMKPGNIMLMRTGHIKLIDFGIARLFRHSGSHDTQLLGTPGFAPPEQYGSAQTDERSDIYSLAMTLFQLMTNTLPDNGFGLQNVRAVNPQISPIVARALEKATALNPEDRYESIVVFRRALLGVDTFIFEDGSSATTPEELAELCARYPEEAGDYLYSGEIESWLQEIHASDLARATRRIRSTIGDPEMGIERFLQTVMGANARTRTYPAIQAMGTNPRVTIPGSRSNGAGQREREPGIVVRPRTIDFGQVYPMQTPPMLLTISGEKGALVSGTITPVEPWILTDQSSFDGMSTVVRVRVDASRLNGSKHYTGTIYVTPDGVALEEGTAIRVEVDVLGYSTTGNMRSRGGVALPYDDEDDLTYTAGASAMQMAPQTLAPAGQIATNTRDSEYKRKYGQPGSGGWDPLHVTPRQRTWMNRGLTFMASLMAACLFYLVLAYAPALARTSLLPPNPWFIAVLLGIVPFATLGALLVNWTSTQNLRETLNRFCTGVCSALLVLGLSEAIWSNLSLPALPQLQLCVMLLITALGATIGTAPRVSSRIMSALTWAVRHMRWVMIALAVLVGGGLGYALTAGFAFGSFTPFGVGLGIVAAVTLVLRVDRLIKHP
jgi:serine/threonine protein kinase